MAQTQTPIAGGQFLTTAADADDVFIREDLTEEQRLFGQTAAEFMQKEVLPVVQRLYEHDWALTRQLLKKASDLDLLRLEIPAAYGGLGLDLISASYVGEQIAINPSFGGSLGAHTSIGTLPLVYFGTDEQKARYLPRLASGELIGAYALTEPQSGSDALAARTTATLTPDGRHYVLNGQKMWITNGGFADLFTIFAKVDGDKFTAFLVERGMGVVSGRDEIKLGLDGSSTTALMLDNVKVPVENVLGTIGQGHKVAFNVLNFGRVKLGARNMSGVKLALNHAVKYAKERRQFGKAIAEFGLIKQKLAGMAIRGFVGDAMSYRTLGDVDRALDAGDRADGPRVLKTIEGFAVECSINKVWTSEALAWAVDEGAAGLRRQRLLARVPGSSAMYRDARITRIYEGTNEINRMLIPTRLLKQSPERVHRRRARDGAGGIASAAAAGPLAERARFRRARQAPAIGLLGHARRAPTATAQGRAGSAGADRRHHHRGLRDRERHRARGEDGGARRRPGRPRRRRRARLHERRGRSHRRGCQAGRGGAGRARRRRRRWRRPFSDSPPTRPSIRSPPAGASPTPSSRRGNTRSEIAKLGIRN